MDKTQTPDAAPAAAALDLARIYFIVFRHKWKVLVLTAIGLLGAIVAKFAIHPPFVSTARLLIRYVEENRPTIGDDGTRTVTPGGRGGESIIRTEVDILTSYDLAVEAATALGPQTLLGTSSGDSSVDLRLAAGMISSGLSVESARNSAVLTVAFSHPDGTVVQPVLRKVIDTYLKRHAEVHRNTGNFDATLIQETDQRRSHLLQIEDELRKLLEQAGIINLADARVEYAARMARIQEEILASEAQLAESRARIASLTNTRIDEPSTPESTPAAPNEIPADKLSAYRQTLSQLPTLYRREQELLVQFTPETPMVRGVRAQINEKETLRIRLEQEYPQLAAQAATLQTATIAPLSSGQPSGVDLVTETAQISALEARRRVLTDQLARVRADATKLANLESTVTELQRTRDLQEQQYRYLSTNLERTKVDEALGPGRVSNISELQSPSPPGRDMKKVQMVMAGFGAGGLLLGLGLAFAIDLFLDRSVKRPAEIEGVLGLPLVLTIPKARRTAAPAALPGRSAGLLKSGPGAAGDTALTAAPTRADGQLRTYFDALRNRLIYNFEMRGITRKPKLVAVTGCGSDSGVSTVAAGLAASLSETGDGNVLLVDMNPDRKTPQFFHKGDLKIGLDDVLAQETRDDAMVGENLYMVSQNSAEDRLSWIMPKKFAQMVPKMKASDFDYIIFDMPPVSQVSATPQLARYMDQVLMVVEAEKTPRDAVKRAGAMLTEAGANVGVILNKSQAHVPKLLDPDALAS